VVDVVGEPDDDPALRRVDDRALDDVAQRLWEMEVVDRDLERALGRRDKAGERLRRGLGRLPAVRQRAELDQGALAARSDALCARFAAW
jgi:hypothetical protein